MWTLCTVSWPNTELVFGFSLPLIFNMPSVTSRWLLVYSIYSLFFVFTSRIMTATVVLKRLLFTITNRDHWGYLWSQYHCFPRFPGGFWSWKAPVSVEEFVRGITLELRAEFAICEDCGCHEGPGDNYMNM